MKSKRFVVSLAPSDGNTRAISIDLKLWAETEQHAIKYAYEHLNYMSWHCTYVAVQA